MEVFTNSKTIKQFITAMTDIDVEPFNQYAPDSKEIDLFLLDDHLLQFQLDYQEDDKICIHEATLLWRRPYWGGGILDMMKFNERVYFLDQRWYRIEYNPDSHYFKFKPCDTPNLIARQSCVLPQYCLLLPEEKQAIQTLLQPRIFGEQLAKRMSRSRKRETKNSALNKSS